MDIIRKVKNKRRKDESFFDYTLLFVVLFLVGFGLIMIYSASSYEANLDYGDPAYYLKRQAIAAALGLVAMIVVSMIPTELFSKFSTLYYIIAMVGIFLLLTPLGIEANGATRWLKTGIGFNVQPAEIAKLCMILFLANVICKMGKSLKSWKGFITALAFPVPICLAVWLISNNLSSAIIIFAIAYLMIFVASPDYKKITLITGIGVAAVVIIVVCIYFFVEPTTENFRFARVLAWFHPEAYAQDEGFQTLQSLYAIGSGGIFGKGLGKSMQKLSYIPEAQNDMIFSILCEELGLFGAFCIMLLFIILIWRCMVIANNAKDLYSALLVVGVMGHFAIQVLLNIAVVTNTIPNTGISLPFISYGGSSVLFLMIEIGIVLGVGRGIKLKDGRS